MRHPKPCVDCKWCLYEPNHKNPWTDTDYFCLFCELARDPHGTGVNREYLFMDGCENCRVAGWPNTCGPDGNYWEAIVDFVKEERK